MVDGTLVSNLRISVNSILRMQSERDSGCPYTPLLTHYLAQLFQSHLLQQLEYLILHVIPERIEFHTEQVCQGIVVRPEDSPGSYNLINGKQFEINYNLFSFPFLIDHQSLSHQIVQAKGLYDREGEKERKRSLLSL